MKFFKFNILKKDFWNYKDIAEFYEVSVKTAIKYKNESIKENDKTERKRGINFHNSDLVNADWVVRKYSQKSRIEKMKELANLLEIYENQKGVKCH